MPKRADVVTAKSPYGVKLGQDEDWLNWSKEEYRHDPWEADKVKKGDVVEVEWAESDKGKGYISSIKVTGASEDVTPERGESPQDESDGQSWSYRNSSMVSLMQTCLKSATDLYVAGLTTGFYKKVPEPGEVFAFAEALKKLAADEA